MNNDKLTGCLSAALIIYFVLILGVLGAVIYGIVALVNHFTA